MKQLLPALLLLLPLLSHGRKHPPLPDSFIVIPGRSACINFETDYVGQLQRRDSMSWTFKSSGMRKAESFGLQFKTAVQHPKALFEDCFLFEPVRQACVAEKDEVFIGTHFFIRPAGETYTNGGTVPASVRF